MKFFYDVVVRSVYWSVLTTYIVYAHTLVALPDTQFYTIDAHEMFDEQTKWICSNKIKLDVSHVAHLGDLVHHPNKENEWIRASDAMKTLETCKMSYTVLPGNHDVDASSGHYFYDKYFSRNRMISNALQGKGDNLSYTFPINSSRNIFTYIDQYEYAVMSLEYMWGYDMSYKHALLSWANMILTHFSNINVVLVSHFAADDCNEYIQDDISDLIMNHCNIRLVIGGHVFYCNGQRSIRTINICGGECWAISSNYQHRIHGGNGYLRFYDFRDSFNNICAYTYSVRSDTYEESNDAWFSIQKGVDHTEKPCIKPEYELNSGYVSYSLLMAFCMNAAVLPIAVMILVVTN